MEVLREQFTALVLAGRGVDILILETFGYLDELIEAIGVAGDITDVPIVAQATFADDAHTLGGETPREVATVLSGLPVAMVGTNCTIGPQRMLTVAEDLVRYASVPVSAQPNAGQPRRTGPGSFEFSIDGDYFARSSAGSPRPGCPWSAAAAAPPPRTSAPPPVPSARWPARPP